MQKEISPYACHIFVCTNDRRGEKKACADGDRILGEIETLLAAPPEK